MTWAYSGTLTNATPRDANELMELLNEARIGIDSIDNTEIDAFTETGAPINMTVAGGHHHDGVDSRLLAPASTTVKGGMRFHRHTAFLDNNTWGTAGSAVDFNAASAIATVYAAYAWWRDPSGVNFAHSNLPADGITAFHNFGHIQNNLSAQPDQAYYILIDDTLAQDRVFVFADPNDIARGAYSLEFTVCILGIP